MSDITIDQRMEETFERVENLSQELDQLIAAKNEEINKTDAEIESLRDTEIQRRFITSFEIVNQGLIQPWTDSSDSPRTTSTYDVLNQHLVKEWSDPASLPKQRTTHDIAVSALTHEWTPSA